MKNRPKLVVYLVINVFLSAAVTLTVLWLWDQAHPTPKIIENAGLSTTGGTQLAQTEDTSSIQQASTPEIEFLDENIDVSIHTIVGSGNLDMEYVEIRNQSQGPIDLTGWLLQDEHDHTFVFPAMILNKDGALKILSGQGTNTVIELYWQSETAIWQSGETARLMNASGEQISSYLIP